MSSKIGENISLFHYALFQLVKTEKKDVTRKNNIYKNKIEKTDNHSSSGTEKYYNFCSENKSIECL